jgi:hypothetical protein
MRARTALPRLSGVRPRARHRQDSVRGAPPGAGGVRFWLRSTTDRRWAIASKLARAWAISETFPFQATTLTEAVRATFERRGRPLPADWPACLTPEFAARADKLDQGRAFLRRTSPVLAPLPFADLVQALQAFLEPVVKGPPASITTLTVWKPGMAWSVDQTP